MRTGWEVEKGELNSDFSDYMDFERGVTYFFFGIFLGLRLGLFGFLVSQQFA